METQSNKLAICSFNCRSVKNSEHEIYQLCNIYDLILLQEHWLLPNKLGILNSVHPDFLSVAHSAVDISSGLLTGRPYGGTAILYRKSLSQFVTRVISSNPRITSVILETDVGPVLIVCVYMPTNYGNAECHEEFIATCAHVPCMLNAVLYTSLLRVTLIVSMVRIFMSHLLNLLMITICVSRTAGI